MILTDSDFNDDGMCAVATACRHLFHVDLSRRLHVGDVGIITLVRSCKNLLVLSLDECVNVTEESLKSIGEASCLTDLTLQGCHLITDLGLKYLANGDLRNHLEILDLAKCDRISDKGIFNLKKLICLRSLNLTDCGVNVTESGIVALSQIPSIQILILSRLINVTDKSLFEIGSKCSYLTEIYLKGCEAITHEGLRAFAHHPTLETLELFSCQKISWKDVESAALTCTSLYHLGLDRRIKLTMPEEASYESVYIRHHYCWIYWE